MKVLVLVGGNNREREVSLRSSDEVIKALHTLGHEVTTFDTKDGYAGLANLGTAFDVAMPIIHGKGGEDGEVQAEIEKLKLKYLGSNVQISKLCFDKVAFKSAVEALGVTVPDGEIVTKETFPESSLIKKPYVLKPIDDGSSVDTFIVRDPQKTALSTFVLETRGKMLLEELIEGQEITVPILGDEALPVIEIVPPAGGEFDYENKYNGATAEICPPQNIPEDRQKEAQAIAEKIHKSLGVRHISRTDLILTPDGSLVVLELNTMPGLTSQSLFPKAAQAAGMTFEQLVDKFLELAIKT